MHSNHQVLPRHTKLYRAYDDERHEEIAYVGFLDRELLELLELTDFRCEDLFPITDEDLLALDIDLAVHEPVKKGSFSITYSGTNYTLEESVSTWHNWVLCPDPNSSVPIRLVAESQTGVLATLQEVLLSIHVGTWKY